MAVRRVCSLLLLGLGGGGLALDLVNVAPTARPAPWTVRRSVQCSPLFSAPKASVEPSPPASANIMQSDDKAKSGEAATAEAPPGMNRSDSNGVPVREGIWRPPSQNVAQRCGNVFSIQQPQDLLDFVIEDERLSVGE